MSGNEKKSASAPCPDARTSIAEIAKKLGCKESDIATVTEDGGGYFNPAFLAFMDSRPSTRAVMVRHGLDR